VPEILKSIEESPILRKQWEKYQHEYFYAKDIPFKDTLQAVKDLMCQ
jgi:hypothetical protein